MIAHLESNRWIRPYLWSTVFAGAVVYATAAMRLDLRIVDLKFGVLALITGILSSRITIKIPKFDSWISVSDIFIFLTLLLYGVEAAILMAATEAFLSSLRSNYCRKWSTVLFNWASAALAAGVTGYTLEILFGDPVVLNANAMSPRFITAVGCMALLQYAANSGIVAVLGALKANGRIWNTWKKHYLWTSITYFAGASAAAVIAKLMLQFGFYAFVITLPIIAIVFFTYRTYLKNI